jgi:hypothetical protein
MAGLGGASRLMTKRACSWLGASALVAMAALTSSPAMASHPRRAEVRRDATISAIPIIAVSEPRTATKRGGAISLAVSVRTEGVVTVATRYATSRGSSTFYAKTIKRTVGGGLRPVAGDGEVIPEVVHFTIKPNPQAHIAIRRRRELRVEIKITLRMPNGVQSGTDTIVAVHRR